MHATATASDRTWHTTKTAAAYTGRHQQTIFAALRSGELHGEQPKVGGHWRIQRPCLDAWVLKQPCPHHTAKTTVSRPARGRGRAA